MTKVVELAGILAAAVIIALIDTPKFGNIEKNLRLRHEVVFYSILSLFVLIGMALVFLRG